MPETLKPDLCVIGGGSGGLSVAAAAATFGVSTVLIERHKMGGDCLNTGCVPSKALLAAAKRVAMAHSAGPFGVKATTSVDFAKVHSHVQQVIAAIAPTDSAERFTGLGVRVIHGHAKFKDRRTVERRRHRHPRTPLRHRHRLDAGTAADPRPRHRSLFHQ